MDSLSSEMAGLTVDDAIIAVPYVTWDGGYREVYMFPDDAFLEFDSLEAALEEDLLADAKVTRHGRVVFFELPRAVAADLLCCWELTPEQYAAADVPVMVPVLLGSEPDTGEKDPTTLADVMVKLPDGLRWADV